MPDTGESGFDRFELSGEALRALDDMGYAEPTPVQADSLPFLLEGRDVIAEAPTGTGKTAAFGLALVERTPATEPLVALVLVPTRELAEQVAAEVSALGRYVGYRAFAVTGGVRESLQLDRLADANCVVATPGRLLDLVRRDEITLAGVRAVVVDEADRMLDEGFLPDAREVLRLTPSRSQTMLFSATLPSAIMDLADEFLVTPEIVRAGGPEAAGVVHYRLNVRRGEKTDALDALLRSAEYDRALVFMNSRANVDATTRELRARGHVADPLHKERGAFARRHVMDLFRRGATRIVIATDVAARGLDVPETELVVNFDVPENTDSYVHRSGRTGRMGRPGSVVTFVTPDEKPQRERIERAVGVTLQPYRLTFAPQPPTAPPPIKIPRSRKRKPKTQDEAPKKPTERPSRESAARRASRLGRPKEESKRKREGGGAGRQKGR